MKNEEIIAELSKEKKDNVVHLVFNPDCSKDKGVEMLFLSDVKILLDKARISGWNVAIDDVASYDLLTKEQRNFILKLKKKI